jgi:hypothetical protein
LGGPAPNPVNIDPLPEEFPMTGQTRSFWDAGDEGDGKDEQEPPEAVAA